MIRKSLASLALLTLTFLVSGCGTDPAKNVKDAKDAAAKIKDMAAKGQEQSEKAMAKAQEMFLKPMVDAFPDIEKKIAALAGDKKTEADTKFSALKKLIDSLKSAVPDKWESLKEGITKAFDELKKMVGL